jgi:hypothetical protein
MDAMMWIVLVSALILAAGGVAYFEVALRRNVFLQRSHPFPGQQDVSNETEPEAQPAHPRCDTSQSQS